jgi:metal-sulfur cluster biosynthetic enzyme
MTVTLDAGTLFLRTDCDKLVSVFRNALSRRTAQAATPDSVDDAPVEPDAGFAPDAESAGFAPDADGDGAAADAGKLATWASDEADVDLLMDLLHEVIDPELGVNIVDLGLIYGVRVVDRVFHVRMTLTTPGCPLSGYIDDEVRRTLSGAPGVDETSTEIVWDPPWSPDMMSDLAKDQLGWRR